MRKQLKHVDSCL